MKKRLASACARRDCGHSRVKRTNGILCAFFCSLRGFCDFFCVFVVLKGFLRGLLFVFLVLIGFSVWVEWDLIEYKCGSFEHERSLQQFFCVEKKVFV